MKRFWIWLLLLMLLLSLCGCNQKCETVDRLFDGLKEYDISAMSEVLDEFPDNSRFVYLDDIFNDEGYQKTYKLLYPSVEYKIVSVDKHFATVKVSMPNIQKLFSDASSVATAMALEDAELRNRLNESDFNGIILIQEIMYSYAQQPDRVEMMNETFKLRFNEDGTIVCNDSLRALITGNFFLSKNTRIGQ
jgi:hypothetical protein